MNAYCKGGREKNFTSLRVFFVCPLIFPLRPILLCKKKKSVQQKKNKKKKLFEMFRNTEGNCSIDFQCAGSGACGGRKIELLFSGLFSIFMPFELCHFFCVCMCVCLHLSAFAHFEMEVKRTRHLFPFAEAAAATVTTHIRIKSIGLNHHYGDGNGLGFGLNLINSKVVSSCFRYNFDYTI